MPRIRGEIVIDRPVEEVFDFVADERNEPLYNPKMTRSVQVSKGPIGVGTRGQVEMAGFGGPAEFMVEVSTYERPRRVTTFTHARSLDIRSSLDFEPVPAGTRMSWDWDLRPLGLLTLMAPWVASWGRHQERVVWTRLKRLMETRAGESVWRHEPGLPVTPDQWAPGPPQDKRAREGGARAPHQAPPRSKLGTAAAGLEGLLAVGALAGGLAVMLRPAGPDPVHAHIAVERFTVRQLLRARAGPLHRPRRGLALGGSVSLAGPAVGSAAGRAGPAGLVSGRDHDHRLLDRSPLQPIYIALGIGIALVGLAWVRQERSQPE